MFTTLLFSCLLTCASPHDIEQPSELVTTIYDLSGVWPDLQGEEQLVPLVPLLLTLDDVDTSVWEPDEDANTDAIITLLLEVVAPEEFEYEGRRLDTLPDGRLRITAPADVHASVARLLELLEQSMHRRALLDIELWRATPDLDLSGPLSSALLDAAQAAGTAQRLAGRHEELLLGHTERREALSVHTFVRDWEPEIAQNAAAAMPLSGRLEVGTRLLLRLQEQPGGKNFDLRFVQQLSELRSIEQRTDPIRSTITADGAPLMLTIAGRLDQPVVAFATLAGSRRLAPGEEFITVARTLTLDGSVAYITRYRLRSVDAAPAPLVLAGPPERQFLVQDLSPFTWPALGYPPLRPAQFLPDPTGDEVALEWLRFPSLERGTSDDALGTALRIDELDLQECFSYGAWGIAAGESDPVRQASAMLTSLSPPQRNLQLDVALLDTGRDGTPRELARASLPLRSGETGLLVTGCARLLLAGYEVTVANSSAMPDPRVGGCVDGLALRAVAGVKGDVLLDVLSHRVLRRDREDLGVPQMSPIDRVELAVAELHPHLQPDGAWHDLVDAGNALGGEGALLLRCRLTSP